MPASPFRASSLPRHRPRRLRARHRPPGRRPDRRRRRVGHDRPGAARRASRLRLDGRQLESRPQAPRQAVDRVDDLDRIRRHADDHHHPGRQGGHGRIHRRQPRREDENRGADRPAAQPGQPDVEHLLGERRQRCDQHAADRRPLEGRPRRVLRPRGMERPLDPRALRLVGRHADLRALRAGVLRGRRQDVGGQLDIEHPADQVRRCSPSGTTCTTAPRTSSRNRFRVDPFRRISHRERADWPNTTCVMPSRFAKAMRPSGARSAFTRTMVAPSDSASARLRASASHAWCAIAPALRAASRRRPRTRWRRAGRRSGPRPGSRAAP